MARVALLLLLSSCSPHALLVEDDRTRIWAEIERSDGDEIEVQTDEGKTLRIPRAKIRRVEHPGFGARLGGGLLVAMGVLNSVGAGIWVPLVDERSRVTVGLLYGSFALAEIVVGILLIRHGFALEAHSEAAFVPGATPLPRWVTPAADESFRR